MNQLDKIYQKDYWEREGLIKRRSPKDPIIAAYVNSRINALKPYVKITKKTRLLDVGCGNGYFTFYFDKICDACGVDYSERLLQMNPARRTFLMDANNLDFEDNLFDMVFSHALLHHVGDIDRVLCEMIRVSKKYVVILDANRNDFLLFLYSLIVKEERKALKFSLAYLKNKLKEKGLKIIASFSYGTMFPNRTPKFLLPLMKLLDFKYPFGITNFIIAKK